MSKLEWTKLVYHLSLSDNSSCYEKILSKKNLQLMKLQFCINNIPRCLGIVDILSARLQYHQFNTFTSVLLSYKFIIYKSSSLWYLPPYKSIIKAFDKSPIYYQFQSNIWHKIHQASDILSISDHYTSQNPTSLWYSINFRAIWLVPAQDVNFFYTRSHLSALQNCALIFSTNFQFIFTFKRCITQFSHWIV